MVLFLPIDVAVFPSSPSAGSRGIELCKRRGGREGEKRGGEAAKAGQKAKGIEVRELDLIFVN